jgi:ankyrin repeat protein/outer membrane protein assembly factor BamD (BamD/ComL family)
MRRKKMSRKGIVIGTMRKRKKHRKAIVIVTLLLIIGATVFYARDGLYWRIASWKGSPSSYARYLQYFPNGSHTAEARERYDERSWQEAVREGEINGIGRLRQYMETFPGGKHAHEAAAKIEDLHWRDATVGNTVKSYQLYLATYPGSKHAHEAAAKIEDLHWRDATVGNTVKSYRLYLDTYPGGKHADEAAAKIEDLHWQEATAGNTVKSYQLYLDTYPGGKHADEAAATIEDLHWQEAAVENTVKSYQLYLDTYPAGRFVPEAQAKQKSLRSDDTPYVAAQKTGTSPAFKRFLEDFPGHKREADVRAALREIEEGRDITDLLKEKKVEIETQGSGIQNVIVRIRRLVTYPITVRIPVGTFFVSRSSSSQNMVATGESKLALTSSDWRWVMPSVVSANRLRSIPGQRDAFSVQKSPNQDELVRLIPVLERAGVSFIVRQAAVWIITDNASYSDLGSLVMGSDRSGGTRVIKEYEAARAMQLCNQAGIDITRKAIWKDKSTILQGLHDASLKGWLQANIGANVPTKTNTGVTNGLDDLIEASRLGHIEAVQALINKGADVNAKRTDGVTALMIASDKGYKEVAQALLDKGGDVNAKKTDGVTALMIASQNGHQEVVQSLIAKGADVNAKRTDGVTALMAVAANGSIEIVQSLLAKGADVNAKRTDGVTALMVASQNGHLEIVQSLLAKGADVNVKDKDGKTGLMAASANGHIEIVRLLLAKGAEVNAKMNNGETVLSHASHKEIKELLIRAGAK